MKTLPLTQGKFAVVSDSDFPFVKNFQWCAKRIKTLWYTVRSVRQNGKKITIYLHRHLLGVSKTEKIDHRDGDGLNNSRRNLRIATTTQNSQGFQTSRKNKSSRFRGVTWVKKVGRWQASIGIKGRVKFIGEFCDEKKAARAYDSAARKYFGRFAFQNFR